ncbi:MAG: hypothetical protein IK082_05060 [Oscillospiraceae bacterium]|nr:hypothetical protein [Oscillospiraceae bacterium]
MIEETVITYLQTALTTSDGYIPVYAEIPAEMPDTFVVVGKTGSGRTNRIDNATLAIKSYAPTLYEAACLNETVKAYMDVMADTENVFRCKLNSDYDYTDTTLKRYRYQAVYDLTY